jgi:hypothetical protein
MKANSGDVMKLHYALTESECIACGGHLEWQLDFKDISRPRYVSYHCDYQYMIFVDNVRINATRIQDGKKQKPEAALKDVPRAILIAQTKKKERQYAENSSKF